MKSTVLALFIFLLPSAERVVHADPCMFEDGSVFCGNASDPLQRLPYLSNETLDHFVDDHLLKREARFSLHAIRSSSGNEFITQDGKRRTTHGMAPKSVFASNAQCVLDDVTVDCPATPVIYQKTDVDGAIVSAVKGVDNSIASIEVVKTAKKDKRDKRTHEVLMRVRSGVYASIPSEAYDREKLRQFAMADPVLIPNRQLRKNNDEKEIERATSSGCTTAIASQNVLKVAVVAESTFCSKSGGTGNAAQIAIQNIMNTVNNFYMQDSTLCRQVQISYLEIQCNANSDPYQSMVRRNLSGCGSRGLLQDFQSYWNSNRKSVRRDLAVLISGTGLECSNSGCVIGCGYVGTSCRSPTSAYSIAYPSFSTDANLRGSLVAHELAHVQGAEHDPVTNNKNWIMEPYINNGADGFSSTAVKAITSSTTSSCIGPGSSTPAPTKRPTKRPTRAPTKRPTRAPTKKPTRVPTKVPTRVPTKVPTRAPTKVPTRVPTKTPTKAPTKQPSFTMAPTKQPTTTTKAPAPTTTKQPTKAPTKQPTRAPTKKPTRVPTRTPTKKPTKPPTRAPVPRTPTKKPMNMRKN